MSEERAPWRSAFPASAAWDSPIETGTVPALLERAAETHPDRPAIEFPERRITYREFARAVEEVASGLLGAGTRRGETIALYFGNTPRHPIVFFAAAWSGARLVHLSPLDAPRELAWKLRDSSARTLITTDSSPLFPRALSLLEEGSLGRLFVATLESVCREVGYPSTIRVDQGTEFVSRDLHLWAYAKGIELDFSRPGKPTDNAFIEAFNCRFRAECVNQHWFLPLADAREKVEAWRNYYNEERPHGAIGNIPPVAFISSDSATNPLPERARKL